MSARDVHVQPNLEVALYAALAADVALAAVADYVGTQLPQKYHCGVVFAMALSSSVIDGWLWRAIVDVHSVSTDRVTSLAALSQALASLLKLEGAVHGACTFGRVAHVTGPSYILDSTYDIPRPSFIGQVSITYHP